MLATVHLLSNGYSSLSYLNHFPIDVLKIDQSIIQDISAGTSNGVIVGAVISMGGNLKQKVIAEGVETHDALSFLKERQCEEGQGYLFSRPLAVEDFEMLFQNGNSHISSAY